MKFWKYFYDIFEVFLIEDSLSKFKLIYFKSQEVARNENGKLTFGDNEWLLTKIDEFPISNAV